MIVIPMAGLSARFTAAGYDVPKYMLPLWGGTVFDQAVGSFASCFAGERFLFVVRDVAGTAAFVGARAAALGIGCDIKLLAAPTAGQAETVALGIDGLAADTRLTIFNIDTFRPGYRRPDDLPESSAGYLEVFRGAGANWSYVRPAAGMRAAETAEKRPISDLCCTGLYEFARADLFRSAYARTEKAAGELFVAPMYNALIAQGAEVNYREVPPDAVIFCGIPAEYEALRDQPARL